jgi:hypothetical protein
VYEKPAYVERPPFRRPSAPPPPVKNGSPVAQAAEKVRSIVSALEEALEEMEYVLELVELAEDQKLDDEREIENLRRALRRIQVPRADQERRYDPRREEPRREEPRRYEEPRHNEPPQDEEKHEESHAERDNPRHEDSGSEEQGS